MPERSADAGEQYSDLRGAAAVVFLVTLVLAELAAAFETSMIIAGMKQLLIIFERPVAIGWLLTSYLLVASGAAALGGRLGDLFGRKKVLMISLGFAVSGSLVSAMSSSLEGILIGRGIQGLSGGILPLCLGLLRENLSEKRIPLGVGIIQSTVSAGAGGGLLLGGILVDYGHWSMIFYCSALTAFLALVLAPFCIPKSPIRITSARNADLFAGALFVFPVAAILLVFSNLGTLGVTDPRIWLTTLVSLAALGLWVRHELRHPNPLINVRLLTVKPIMVANLTVIFLALSGMAFAQFFILMIQQPILSGVGLGITATIAGLVKLPGNIVSTITAPIDGHLVARFGARAVIVAGGVISGTGMAAFIFADQQMVVVVLLSMMVTVGATAVLVATSALVITHAPGDRTSEAVGVMTVVRSVFHAFGVQMTMIALAAHTVPGSPYPDAMGFYTALALMSAMSFMSAVTAGVLLRRDKGAATG